MSDEEVRELPFPDGLPKHRVYELVVKKVVERLEPGATVHHDAKIPVVGDDRVRQVDVYVDGRISGFPFSIVIDCKHYGKPLDVKDVDAFLGMLDDIKPNMGVLVSLNGFGSGAKKRAAKEARRLNLCSVFLGGQPEFSAPIGIGVILVQRTDLELWPRLDGGYDLNGPIPRDARAWQLVDGNGERWTILDLATRAQNTPQFADAENGTYVVPSDSYKFVCMDGSEQPFARLEIDFRSKLRFFRRSTHFDTGVALLDGEGAVIASADLGVTVPSPSEADPWEEISPAHAKAGLVAELK